MKQIKDYIIEKYLIDTDTKIDNGLPSERYIILVLQHYLNELQDKIRDIATFFTGGYGGKNSLFLFVIENEKETIDNVAALLRKYNLMESIDYTFYKYPEENIYKSLTVLYYHWKNRKINAIDLERIKIDVY